MSTDAKKEPAGNNRVSRRVECLKSEAEILIRDVYAEASPIDKGDDDPAGDSPGNDSEGIDKSAGFNPYDTGSLYKN